MLHVRLIILVMLLYDNNVRISLRTNFLDKCGTYYVVKDSQLREHRDEHVDVKAPIAR